MNIKKFNDTTESDLDQISFDLIENLKQNIPIILHGDLGMGKTTLVKRVLLNIGSTEIVTSPTFSLVHVYDSPIGSIHHFDLYRINKDDDLMNIGFYDVLHHSPMIVEWPRVLVQPCISIDIKQGTSPSTRCIKIESHA